MNVYERRRLLYRAWEFVYYRIVTLFDRKLRLKPRLLDLFFTTVVPSGIARNVYYGRPFHYSARSGIGQLLYFEGEFEAAEIAECRRHLSDGSVVLDIGANIGVHTVQFAAAVGEGLVFALEPSLSTFEELLFNCRGYANVRLLNVAATDRVGLLTFFESEDSGLSGLKDTRRKAVRRVTQVLCARVDDWFPPAGVERLDLVKIDVEGTEQEVLLGMTTTLKRFKPAIVCEINGGGDFNPDPDGTLRYLTDLGYEASVLVDGRLVPCPRHDDRHSNYFFAHSEASLK